MNIPNVDTLINVMAEKNDKNHRESLYQPIRLTPKGKRWGDVIRKELTDPDSRLSCVVREFKAWTRIAKSDKKTKLELDYCGNIIVNVDGNISNIAPEPDVGYLFPLF
jgi:hypothetical protein